MVSSDVPSGDRDHASIPSTVSTEPPVDPEQVTIPPPVPPPDAPPWGGTPGGILEVLHIAYPLILSTGSHTIMRFVDRLFLAWLGPENIAAGSPAGLTSFTIMSFFLGVAAYTNTFVAQYYGAGQLSRCGRSTWQGIYFSLITWPLLLVFAPLAGEIFRLVGHAPEVQELEVQYFSILMMGAGTVPLSAALSAFFTGRGRTRVIMAVNFIANGVNVALDYCLIFGRWGFPQLGIRGAAVATVLSHFLLVAILFVLFLRREHRERYATGRARLDSDLFRRMLRFGAPSGIQTFLDVAAFSSFVLFVGRIGVTELAVSNICLSINLFAFLPLTGFSVATQTLVGQYIGRRNPPTAEKSTYSAARVALLYVGSVGVVYLLFPRSLLGIFDRGGFSSEEFEYVVAMGKPILILMVLFGVFDALNLVFAGALKGAGDTRFIMWALITIAWVFFVPPVYLIVEVLRLGIFAVWIWLAVYAGILGVVFLVRFRRGKWRRIDVLGRTGESDARHDVVQR
jgi:MATE family multidrug resistance protein